MVLKKKKSEEEEIEESRTKEQLESELASIKKEINEAESEEAEEKVEEVEEEKIKKKSSKKESTEKENYPVMPIILTKETVYKMVYENNIMLRQIINFLGDKK